MKTLKTLVLGLVLIGLISSAFAQEAALPKTLVPANKLSGWWCSGWWKARHEANKARIEQGNVDFLLLGDSITHGWDGGAYASAFGWDALGNEVVEKYYYGDRNFVNMGFGGDETQHILWRLNDAPMNKIQPKAAMLLIGINSLVDDWPNCTDNVALGIKACVDKLQSLYPDIKILVLHIFIAHEKPDDPIRARLAKTNAAVDELLKDYKNVTIMDLNHLWLNPDGTMNKSLAPDCCHPNKEGYKRWGAAVEPVISKMLGVEAKKPME